MLRYFELDLSGGGGGGDGDGEIAQLVMCWACCLG